MSVHNHGPDEGMSVVEDAARAVADEMEASWVSGVGYTYSPNTIAKALATAGLLARPGRDEIARVLDREGAFCGECGGEPGEFFDSCAVCQRILLGYADAVLALLAGGTTVTEVAAPAREPECPDCGSGWAIPASPTLDGKPVNLCGGCHRVSLAAAWTEADR